MVVIEYANRYATAAEAQTLYHTTESAGFWRTSLSWSRLLDDQGCTGHQAKLLQCSAEIHRIEDLLREVLCKALYLNATLLGDG